MMKSGMNFLNTLYTYHVRIFENVLLSLRNVSIFISIIFNCKTATLKKTTNWTVIFTNLGLSLWVLELTVSHC